MTTSLQNVVGRFSFAEFLGNFYMCDPMGGVIALSSKKKYAEEIVDALNAMRDSKEKCGRNRDNWKKRAEVAEAKLDWLMVQGIRGIAPGWVGIPEVEWDSTYPPNPSHHAEPRFGGDSVDGVVGHSESKGGEH